MHTNNLTVLLIAITIIVAAIVYLDSSKAVPAVSTPVVEVVQGDANLDSLARKYDRTYVLNAEKDKQYERAKEITTPDGFINTPSTDSTNSPQAGSGQATSITIGEFVGKKVVLLDIWTYSCINCQRTIPYLNSWWAKYKNKGLVIIGLHTPEFEFEKKYENVLTAVKKFGIEYPVVLDNDYSTWRAYRNQYWPRKYLIDIDGYIVYNHIGEGGYEETERQIQKALTERMARLGETGNVEVAVTEEKTVTRPESPETYFGASRNENFGNGERNRVGVQTLTVPKEVRRNILYLGGEWDIQGEYAENKSSGAEIVFKYKAKEVYFVASSEAGVRAKIYNDGVLVHGGGAIECRLKGFCGGEDVSADGTVRIKEDRLYKLIQNDSVEEHALKIEIESPGLKAFTFTFG